MPRMSTPDGSYKWLFGEPRLVADLLRAFVPGPQDGPVNQGRR